MSLFQKLSLTTIVCFTLLIVTRVNSAQPPPYSCEPSDPSTKNYPFCQQTLSIDQRVKDLLSRLTVDEKIPQLGNDAPAIPRLGIPAFQWWSEALHGVTEAGRGVSLNQTIKGGTTFPQVILTAASFDVNLWYRIGQAIGTEARAVYNAGQARGMTFWAPNINIFRDPRWGRGQETPGEDPFTASKYAVAYVRGLQGDSFEGGKLNGYLQASACCKHFTAYDLENWMGNNRFKFDARVTAQDLADTYNPPFEQCVKKGGASGIMCAYNQVNGVPNCADYNLLTKTARGLWGFYGYIVSDCDAVSVMHDAQGYSKTPEDAVGAALKAGMDVNCGGYVQTFAKSALQQNKLSEADIDRALYNLFSIRMRLGLFDGTPSKLRYGNIGADRVCSPAHRAIALQAAQEGIVLLKNSDHRLPLSKSETKSLAVIGPNGNNAWTLIGNYAGPPCNAIEIYQALKSYVKDAVFEPGCEKVECSSPAIDKAVEIAKQADNVVLVMGLDQTQEREEMDRTQLTLPGKQQELIISVAKAAKKPVILVIVSGGPVDISFTKDDSRIGSILWAGYPGEVGGVALAEIIFGDHNPGGRLPVTWYPSDYVKVPMTDMRMRPDKTSGYPGRTYRFYTGEKVFPFGYGLSYSKYSYKFHHVSANQLYLNTTSTKQILENNEVVSYKAVSDLGESFCENNKLSVRVGIKNHGDMAGKHPILLFVKPAKKENGRPIKQLVGFESVILRADEKAEIEFELKPCAHFSRATEYGSMIMEEGTHFLVVGDEEYPVTVVF